ncbi:MAG TPA: tetratricopeptide repeat protein [Geminicoccaceae bacterium]|nr:tetratricopeptide repeat protein [Geminicoccaceae bacterium]
MADPGYRLLRIVAIALALAYAGYAVHGHFFGRAPGDLAYLDAENLFASGDYDRAAARFRETLAAAPDHDHALRGLAQSLHMQGRHDEALAAYDEAIARDPGFAAAYANRGIALDTLGRHEEALRDYERALELNPELAAGPHWLTRFLRNQPERPPTIADRAAYLRSELAKPEDERLLRVPEADARQRPYKL